MTPDTPKRRGPVVSAPPPAAPETDTVAHAQPRSVNAGDACLSGDEDVISVVDLWHVLKRHKWMILAVTLAAVLASSVAALLMTPKYRSEAVLSPVSQDEGISRYAGNLDRFGSIAALVGVDLSQSGSRKNEAMATLQSRLLTEQFIRDEKLLPVLFHDRWDARNERWNVRDPDDIPTLGDAYELFDEDVRHLSDSRRNGMVILTIEWDDPELAADWANELVERTNAMLRNRTEEEAQRAIDYLRAELDETSAVELQQVLHRLIESQMKEIILTKATEQFAFRVIDPARPADKPFRPRPVEMAVISGVLALLASVVFVLLRDLAGRRSPAHDR